MGGEYLSRWFSSTTDGSELPRHAYEEFIRLKHIKMLAISKTPTAKIKDRKS